MKVEGSLARLKCQQCGEPFAIKKALLKHGRGRACSKSCRSKLTWKTANMSKAGAHWRGKSLTPWNKGKPWPEEHRRRMSEAAKAAGRTIKIKGGNGTGMANAEGALSQVLPPGWVWSFAVSTKGLDRKALRLPTNYKIDFAYPKARVAIEVDGSSHHLLARQAQDRKKEAALRALGWSVLRLSNAQALSMSSTSQWMARLSSLLRAVT